MRIITLRNVLMTRVKLVLVCICWIFVIVWMFPFDGRIGIGTLLDAFGRRAAGEAAPCINEEELKFANQSHVVFTVKTTKRFHNDRIELILKTWRKGIESQVSRSSRAGLSRLFSTRVKFGHVKQ